MPWQCRLLPSAVWWMCLNDRSPRGDLGTLRIGDMCLDGGWALHSDLLSPEYKRDWAPKRAPILVVVPGPMWVCVDMRATDKQGNRLPNGWTVTGDPPRITVTPSVDTSSQWRPNGWHGWIRDGVIT